MIRITLLGSPICTEQHVHEHVHVQNKKGFSDVHDELNYTCCLSSFMGICSNANVLTVMS